MTACVWMFLSDPSRITQVSHWLTVVFRQADGEAAGLQRMGNSNPEMDTPTQRDRSNAEQPPATAALDYRGTVAHGTYFFRAAPFATKWIDSFEN